MINRDYLRMARATKKLSQTEAAKVLGIARVTYVSIENGARKPSIEVFSRMVKTFDMDANKLLNI